MSLLYLKTSAYANDSWKSWHKKVAVEWLEKCADLPRVNKTLCTALLPRVQTVLGGQHARKGDPRQRSDPL